MPRNVLLLRSPAEDGGPDKYEAAFRARGYSPVSVPVLETVHTNMDALAAVLARGGGGVDARYAGVIVTSARACGAWRAAVQRLAGGDVPECGRCARTDPGWARIPFYAVGSGTSSALAAVHDAFPSSPYAPRDIRGGAECGTGEKLARFIVADVAENPTLTSKRLLYLTGDKNRDTLPRILSEGGLELESLQAYATQGSTSFEDDLHGTLHEVSGDDDEEWWIVHFAPSAADTVSPTLGKYFDMPAAASSCPPRRRRARIATIGPTTSTYLRDKIHIDVAVVAEKPTPEALSDGIAAWDRANGPRQDPMRKL
ncbi:tetrapyrrole biosynthesis uroporphyrinogen III synthase [Trametes elegans]|nr:tetrapyrrole biosynthesis uroporphyrinogen III synthase [Trametes elegans]